MSNENRGRLIGFIKSKDNSLLDDISSVYVPDEEKMYGNENRPLNDAIIKKAGVTKGNSWVERFFDDLRCKSKIYKIEKKDENHCLIYIDEKSWVGFRFVTAFNSDGDESGEEFEIENDKGWVISYRLVK